MKPKATLFEIDPHPAHPPADLLKKWEDLWFDEEEHADVLLIRAFQAGADQELEACCEWLRKELYALAADGICAARRPKPQSLNSIALEMVGAIERDAHYLPEITDTIRRALEQLND
jgi:hypothetical protein